MGLALIVDKDASLIAIARITAGIDASLMTDLKVAGTEPSCADATKSSVETRT